MLQRLELPPFVPHPLLRGGHLQTLAAAWGPSAPGPYQAQPLLVALPDGDALVVHDDCPAGWWPSGPLVLMSHGLGGCHRSPYMSRIAHRLNERGVRTWRIDLRGFGHSMPHCTRPGHAGRSEDLRAVLDEALRRHGEAELALLGFSMGGNIVLKLLGELGESAPPQLRAAAAVAPPVNIFSCAVNMKNGLNRLYSRQFIHRLMKYLHQRRRRFPELSPLPLHPRPLHIMEFDERFTAPLSGFLGARDYYQRASAAVVLPAIQVPTLILSAQDDPVIPAAIFDDLQLSPSTQLHLAAGGGHVGFFSNGRHDPDRCWMDWRLLHWFERHLGGGMT